jgi:hypothetical protein
MNTNGFNDPDQQGAELGRAMGQQVGGLHDAPLTVEAVQARATTIRRNRRLIVAAGLAAATAILVPSAILASNSFQRSDGPPVVNSPTQAPEPSDTGSPEPTPTTSASESHDTVIGGSTFDVSDLPTGAAPAVAWADGLTIHRADGTTVDVTGVDRIDQLAPMGDGWVIATGDDQGNLEVVLLDANGVAGDRFPLDGGLATSPEGKVVAWASPNGAVTVVGQGGAEVLKMPPITARGPYSAIAVTSEDCKEGRTTDAGCTVYVNTKGAKVAAYYTSSHGIVDLVSEEFLNTTAYAGDRILAGITEISDTGTCSIVQRDYRQILWETCDHRVLGFSPDGNHVVAAQAYGDGLGDGEFAILDAADGTPLVDLISEGDTFTTVMDTRWEDDTHVLIKTFQNGKHALVRISLDGEMEYAVPPVPGEDVDSPFVLSAGH